MHRNVNLFNPNLFKIIINDLPKYLQETPDFASVNGRPVHCMQMMSSCYALIKSILLIWNKLSNLLFKAGERTRCTEMYA
jgi:hypothetical protein